MCLFSLSTVQSLSSFAAAQLNFWRWLDTLGLTFRATSCIQTLALEVCVCYPSNSALQRMRDTDVPLIARFTQLE